MILFTLLALHALPTDPVCDDEDACRQARKSVEVPLGPSVPGETP